MFSHSSSLQHFSGSRRTEPSTWGRSARDCLRSRAVRGSVWLDLHRVLERGSRRALALTSRIRLQASPIQFIAGSATARIRIHLLVPGDQAFNSPPGSCFVRATRLTFKRDLIEALAPDEQFEVVTPFGVYRFTKEEFHSEFGAGFVQNSRITHKKGKSWFYWACVVRNIRP
jgi:hypothetical protein